MLEVENEETRVVRLVADDSHAVASVGRDVVVVDTDVHVVAVLADQPLVLSIAARLILDEAVGLRS